MDRTQKIKSELERKNAMFFDRVWVVFDKDDFDDFNEAIEKAHELGFNSAWTNELLNYGTTCTSSILIQVLVGQTILRNSKKLLETE